MNVTALKHAALAAMPMSLVKQYTRLFNPAQYRKEFKKWGSGKGPNPHRIYIPAGKKPLLDRQLTVDPKVEQFLTQHGYIIDNYMLGTAINVKTKKTAMITDLLKDNLKLAEGFESDPQRATANMLEGKSLVVISRHPYDIAGIAFGRIWKAWQGDEIASIKDFIRNGTLVAYRTKLDGRNVGRPAGAVLIDAYKNFKRPNVHALHPRTGQSANHPVLAATASAFAGNYNKSLPDGAYFCVCPNGKNKVIFLKGGKLTNEQVAEAYNTGRLSSEDLEVLRSYGIHHDSSSRVFE